MQNILLEQDLSYSTLKKNERNILENVQLALNEKDFFLNLAE